MNCLLFLLAVIPSHIHGFYISWTYFFRRRKVLLEVALGSRGHKLTSIQAKKGKYPGGPKPFIYSQKVVNGGLSNAEVKELWRRKEYGIDDRRSGRRVASGRETQTQRKDSHRPRHTARHPSKQHYSSHNQDTAAYREAQRPASQVNHTTEAHDNSWPMYR